MLLSFRLVISMLFIIMFSCPFLLPLPHLPPALYIFLERMEVSFFPSKNCDDIYEKQNKVTRTFLRTVQLFPSILKPVQLLTRSNILISSSTRFNFSDLPSIMRFKCFILEGFNPFNSVRSCKVAFVLFHCILNWCPGNIPPQVSPFTYLLLGQPWSQL